ncbi:DUF6270 domain-containing protein [Isoptericola sp. 178]|uniref:DUF6270 domain-containing protein n=1 Tax=Isoptericola sp. 178 TaxID=3064651 RepID=UPI0027127B31|nr:DUF6270 domain-containing protein [Isoptericola sp. 178]MDO8143937.1 DUF6270 domain-containing protein [Isoptericola sp. 178]
MSKTRVFIYGSCVSRDTFDYLPSEDFELAQYVARQSALSAYTNPVSLISPPELASSFQQRMISGDFSSNLRSVISGLQDVDLVLMDLTDERHGVYILPDGTVVTRSIELIESGLEHHLPPGSAHIPFGTPTHFQYWSDAIDQVAQMFAAHLPRTGIALLDIPWATVSDTGQVTPASFGVSAEDVNPVMAEYVDHATRALSAQRVSVDRNVVHSGSDHPWGEAPFHYSRGVYQEAVRQLLGGSPDGDRLGASGPLPATEVRSRDDEAPAPEVPATRMSIGPNIILAGTQKAGLEWLKNNIAKHPETFAETSKASNLFSKPLPAAVKELREAEELYAEGAEKRYRIECSPSYFRHGDGTAISVPESATAEMIRDFAPIDSRIVLVLRDPIERAATAFWSQFAAGKFDLPQSIFTLDPKLGILDYGFYERHYHHWASVLGADRIEVLLYDDLADNPKRFMEDVLQRLDLEPSPGYWDNISRSVPSDNRQWMQPFKARWPISEQELSVLSRLYDNDIEFISDLTGRDLSNWKASETKH